ncbi:MAG: ribosomal RNA small subunit methyltransferase A [Pelagibacteraceae bacterium TMED216]|nr:MAG: ribosomal RNA small subunit methyltransferase A [Pelagibacteraceae bacterium TMED216]|tara:strand:- start:677 stop:1483 length:807 start_codon:yes stop_codon:yes gene_type:complete
MKHSFFKTKKSLGQNFLIDKNILKKIVSTIKVRDNDIFEIGGGKGALTNFISMEHPKSIKVIEKDNNLYEILSKKYSKNKNIKILKGDILKFNLENNLSKNSIIFGNLPYNIATKIFTNLLTKISWPPKYKFLILMFQKEVGEKIIAEFKTKNYGRLSLISNFRLEVLKKFIVSKNCFFPKPKVDSMVIYFKPIVNSKHKIKEIRNLEKISNIFFSNRRKMINKTMNKLFMNPEKIYKKINILPSSRPSDINNQKFFELVEAYEKEGN